MYIEKEIIRKTSSTDRIIRSVNESHFSYNLPLLIENLKTDQKWLSGGLNLKVLLRKPDKKVVLTILHAGTEINSSQTNNSITIQILEGSLNLHILKKCVTLKKGERLTISDKLDYSYNSVEETAFLLTLT